MRRRCRSIGGTAEQQLEKKRLLEAPKAGFGAWKDEDHPELNGPDGTAGWVRPRKQYPRLWVMNYQCQRNTRIPG